MIAHNPSLFSFVFFSDSLAPSLFMVFRKLVTSVVAVMIQATPPMNIGYLIQGGSVAGWLACWTQVQKGLGSNRSRDAVG